MKRLIFFTFCLIVCVDIVNAKIVFTIRGDIYVCEDDGTKRHALTKNTAHADFLPRWSPDGTKIVFQRRINFFHDDPHDHYEKAGRKLFIMDANGTNLQQLTKNSDSDSYPSWSPDGTRIALMRTADKRVEVHVMELESRTVTRLTGAENQRGSAAPDWSPDGTQIVFERFIKGNFAFSHKTLYVMSANGDNQRPILPDPLENAAVITMMFEPRWSSDGRRVLFVNCLDKGLEKGGQTCRLTMLWIDGKTETFEDIYDKLGPNLLIAGHCWMDKDRAILFSAVNMDDPHDDYDIYRYELETRNLKLITKDPRHDDSPDWIEGPLSVSPHGKLPTQWGEKKKEFAD